MIELDQLLEFLKGNFKVILIVLVSISLSSYGTSLFKQTEIDEYIEEYEKFEEEVDEALKFADQMKLLAEQYEIEIERLNDTILIKRNELKSTDAVIDSLKLRLDSVKTTLSDSILSETPPEVLSYIDILETSNKQLTERVSAADALIQSLDVRNAMLGSALDLQVQRADSLQIVLSDLPDAPSDPDKLFWIIPKPTRTQTFIIGAVIGGFAAWQIGN